MAESRTGTAERIRIREDSEALLVGLSILGTGGGGDPCFGRVIMQRDRAAGRRYTIVDPEDVPDGATVVSGGYMGSVKTLGELGVDRLVEGWETRFELTEAVRLMSRQLGRPVDYIVPFEMGGLNTPVILSAGARLGIPVVNGDGLGRAAPETQMTSFLGHGVPVAPMPLVDRQGNAIVVSHAVEDTFPDEIGRWMIMRGGGTGANNHYPMTGKDLKRSVIPHTITLALEIGRAVLRARQEGEDPCRAFASLTGAQLLLAGTVREIRSEDAGGFYRTEVVVAGRRATMQSRGAPELAPNVPPQAGVAGEKSPGEKSCLRIGIKNETMVCWLDGKLACVFPDLLCMLDPETGNGAMSIDLKKGMNLAFYTLPCHERLREAVRSQAGRKAMASERYGFKGIEWVPVEELARRLQD